MNDSTFTAQQDILKQTISNQPTPSPTPTQFTPHQLTDNVKLLHKVVLCIDNKILILKRSPQSKSRPNKWDLPGGNSEWPSDVNHNVRDLHTLDAAREVWEETGIRVGSDNFINDSLTYFSTFFEAEKQIFTVICGWSVSLLTDVTPEDVTISEEHSEFALISLDELNDYDFGGEAGSFIIDIIASSFDLGN